MKLERLRLKPTIKWEYNQAVLQLTKDPILDGVDPATIDAIRHLVQAAGSKEVRRLKPGSNPFKLASRFRAGKEEVRYYLQAIHSTGTYLEATTGHVYIRVKHACEPGVYSDTGLRLDVDWKYPSFLCLNDWFQEAESFNWALVEECNTPVTITRNSERTGIPYLKIPRSNGGFACFDKAYVDLARKAGPEKFKVTDKALCFFGPDDRFEGVIMALIL